MTSFTPDNAIVNHVVEMNFNDITITSNTGDLHAQATLDQENQGY